MARNALLEIRSKQSVPFEGRTVGADEWLLDVLFRPGVADRQPTFFINDPDVLGLLGIQQTSDRYYSFATLMPRLEAIETQAQAAQGLEAGQRNRFQSAILNLYSRLVLYHRLQNTVQMAETPLTQELLNLGAPVPEDRYPAMDRMAHFRILPPAGQGEWMTVGRALEAARAQGLHPFLLPLAKAGAAYAAGNPPGLQQPDGRIEGPGRRPGPPGPGPGGP